MKRVLVLYCLLFTLVGVHCKKDPEADFRKLPKLFHLDDYERCLERKDGVYCLGMFEIYSDIQPNPIYDIIQEKSKDKSLYNRTFLHRGYCLPTRCPPEANETARFERCVDAWARTHALRTRLHTLHYCRAHGQPRPLEPDTNDLPHTVLLYFVYTMMAMAVIGTVYDVYFATKESKNTLLMSFSIRINWNHFSSDYKGVDSRLRDLEFFNLYRFLLGIGLVVCHVFILTTATYQHNPRYMEKLLAAPNGFSLGVGMVFTLMFILLSNFLVAYNMLLLSPKINYSLRLFPLLVVKRVIRMYPVYLLMNGFAATWWRSFGDGPLWPVLLAKESEVCRKKFWVTAAFLQNFVNKKELCLVQTWIMAVDMQLHLLTLFLTLALLKHRQHAVKILSMFLVAAIAVVTHQAFAKDLVPSYLYTNPESYRTMFVNEDSFFDLYIHPINGIIMAIAGTMLAFIHMDHQTRDVQMSRSKILVLLHYATLPLMFLCWYLCFVYFKHYDRRTQHAMVVAERVFVAILLSFKLYSYSKHKGVLRRLLTWRALRTVTKLSFSMSMCHWCINVLLLTNRWTLHQTTGLQLLADTVAVHVMAHIVAIPLTLFVEFPMQKFLERLINQSGQRWFAPLKAKAK